MAAESPESRSVTITRLFDAPRELVFRAWTEAEHVVRWMKCDVAATLEVADWVAEVGNEFRTHMVHPGVFEVRGSGRFTAVDPPRLLEYVIDADPSLGVPEMTVRVSLEDRDGKTELTLTQTGIPNDFIHGVVNGGWTASLAQLETVLGARLIGGTSRDGGPDRSDGPDRSERAGQPADGKTPKEAHP